MSEYKNSIVNPTTRKNRLQRVLGTQVVPMAQWEGFQGHRRTRNEALDTGILVKGLIKKGLIRDLSREPKHIPDENLTLTDHLRSRLVRGGALAAALPTIIIAADYIGRHWLP